MQETLPTDDYRDLETLYGLEDHTFAAVHADVGSVEAELDAEQKGAGRTKVHRD